MKNTLLLSLALAITLAGCDLLDVENPNNLVENDLDNPAGAVAMANGLEFSLTRCIGALLSTYGTTTDELTWVGSRDAWRNLDIGVVDDPLNEFSNGLFEFVGEARWLSEDFINRLEAFDAAGVLTDRSALTRAYLYRAIVHTVIADMYDDFAFSNREEPGPAIGPANMNSLYDIAIAAIDNGLAMNPSAELETQLRAMRARTQYSKALWSKVKPTINLSDPLVNDAGANADAQAALDLMSDPDWFFELELDPAMGFPDNSDAFSIGFQVNNRNELRFGVTYILPSSDGLKVEEVTFKDFIDTETVHPFVQNTIDVFEADGQYPDFTIASAREMHLILAEAALAAADDGAFTESINAIRTLDGLTPYSGQVDATELLINSRQANLFNQGRRLMDMYRFALSSPEWTENGTTVINPGTFFPIADIEIKANPLIGGGG